MVNFKQIQNIIQKEIIQPLGENQVISLIEPDSGLFDAGNPQDGPGTSPTTHSVNAVVIPVEREGRRPDAVISRGEIKILTSGLLTVEPKVGWQAVVQGITHRITEVSVTRPGSTVLLYTMVAER